MSKRKSQFVANPAFESELPSSFLKTPADPVVYRSAENGKQIGGLGWVKHRLLTADGEKFLFLKMNYLKYLAFRTQSQNRREHFLAEATRVRNEIAECNYGLVMTVANRFMNRMDLEDVVSECFVVLLKAIDKFDVARGFKFSTYATLSMQRCAHQMYQRQLRRRTKSVPGKKFEETVADREREQTLVTAEPARIESVISEVEACLDRRERFVIRKRYGLDGPAKKLREVAETLGVTQERVRQIQTKAIKKIRNTMSHRLVDWSGVV